MATSASPVGSNGAGRLEWIRVFWPIIVAVAMVITGYATLGAQVRQNTKDIDRLEQPNPNRVELTTREYTEIISRFDKMERELRSLNEKVTGLQIDRARSKN
jgi:hypothetical protein